MKRFLLLFVFIFAGTQKNFAQEKLSETQKLETLAKVWGFLKYYHPNVAKGNFNWDKQLVEKIIEAEKINSKAKYNDMLSSWIDSLGKVDFCKKCTTKKSEKYFLKNFDLSWTDDAGVFDPKVIEKLNFIEENRNLGDNHYITVDRSSVANYRNEKTSNSEFISGENSLLELFRYWNFVEYFFPYKYQTDQKWSNVLTEMIPKFSSVKNTRELHLAVLELVTKTDDSHSYFSSKETNSFFGMKMLPVHYKFIDGQLIITEIAGDFGSKTQLRKNDIILKINSLKISQIFENTKKYLPASNTSVKERNFVYSKIPTRSNDDNLTVQILRDDKIMELNERTYPFNDIRFSQKKNIEGWKMLSNQVAYVDMGILQKENVDKMFAEIKDSKAIIFDIRNYPKGTIHKLSLYLFPERLDAVSFTSANFSYPGKYNYMLTQKYGRSNNSSYKGKIVVLVNEITQSHAEYTSMILNALDNTTIIGSQTSGADGNVNEFQILGNPTRFSCLGTFYPDGTETQRIGILPDIISKPTIEGIKNDKDEVLERALEFIETGK
ncbi:hypothetical protein ASG31_15760 [Chryseobacterium sp. Leaf404]|uniref:S41 family peptidase n=1 Tax=unclassified Chryseobacterium TaxID=2593645 RepID=UPI0006FD2EC2|nr:MULTISPECIES: S41 family peptidase [unclassified Chryseobacterium]KQT15056.1 hypothetical protein ASG31_15760 [Chryseobacterium sp. Leaf404]